MQEKALKIQIKHLIYFICICTKDTTSPSALIKTWSFFWRIYLLLWLDLDYCEMFIFKHVKATEELCI